MKSIIITTLLTLVSSSVLPREAPVNYDGYKVFRVEGDISSIKDSLSSLQFNELGVGHSGAIDYAVSPSNLEAFIALGLDATTLQEDLGAAIKEESAIEKRQSSTWFNAYHAWADHNTWLKQVQASFPSNSEIISSGTSYEGRDLFGIHLWGSGGKGSKPAVIFHGNVHAREWITSMTVEYITQQLVTGYTAGTASAKTLLDKYDYYIIPFVNPDGFVYSQTTDRLWRKNRQPAPSSTCVGRDINRNWPYQWDANDEGASPNPCSETFRGTVAGDAPENKGLLTLVESLQASKGIKLYVDWHSYGQYILSPYGYSCSATASNNAAHQTLMAGTATAIRNAGYSTRFTYGPICSTLYATTGSSVDYVKSEGGAEYSVTFELRDTGTYGFVLPASQILPTGKEMWTGIQYMLTNM